METRILARFTARALWLAPRYRRRRLVAILALALLGLGLTASEAGAVPGVSAPEPAGLFCFLQAGRRVCVP